MTVAPIDQAKTGNMQNPRESFLDAFLDTLKPKDFNDPAVGRDLLKLLHMVYTDEQQGLVALAQKYRAAATAQSKAQAQADELLKIFKALKDGPATFVWVLSRPYEVGNNGATHKVVMAEPLARGGGVPRPFVILESDKVEGAPALDLPAPPYLALGNISAGAFLGPVPDPQGVPIPADLRTVVSARDIANINLGEIEVCDAADQRSTLLASRELTQAVARRLDDGEAVTVRDEGGLARGIHRTNDVRDECVEEVPLDGPRLSELKYRASFKRELARDVDWICAGRALRVLSIGSTGTGKTETVTRVVREAGLRLNKRAYVVRVSATTIGSKFIHETARHLKRAIQQAKNLARKGFVVAILVDECDALLGETADSLGEHSHNREERLAFQELFSQDIPGVAVYLTMNPRRHSSLPVAINRRFRKRAYARTSRSLMAAIASLYVTETALAALGMRRDEFGQMFADLLFNDRQVVGTAHFHSGKQVVIRIRDLQVTSPGKARDLIDRFCVDLDDGWASDSQDLEAMVVSEFQVPELCAANLHDLTFLEAPRNDSVRSVEIAH